MTSNTSVMFDRFGDVANLELRSFESGPVPDGHVRVDITVAGLNPVDWQIVESRDLAEAFGITTPVGFGNDFAGVITETGSSVTEWRVGDRVYGGARGAALASSVVLHENHPSMHSTPDSISDRTAGVLDITGRPASAVADALAVRSGETVLVGSAGGGVGSILVQLLVRAGARVIGSGSLESADFIRSLGAVPVEYGSNLERGVRVATTGPVAAATDLHGMATAKAALALGVPPHRIVTIESDTPPAGTLAVNGSDAQPVSLSKLTELISAGELFVHIAAVYPLEQFAQAIAHQRSRHVNGKIAIEIS
ncbi:NADP-dependent oxidoreductase [Rhodococcus sp. IEGM1428]|uniref:NADP-dependent oxidoreductase n=1 Tax=Rhodococcus sp. IEGM1428 TaxID=3392191 RepID=UPI003D152A70